MTITHSKVSAKSDPADTSLVRPSDWNDDHVVVIGADEVGFTPAGTIAATDVQAAIEEVAAEAGSGGAPTTADYLVGTAQAGLSAEIVVGTAPAGELGGTWAAPTVDASHSGTTHAAAQAAAEATAAAALAAHLADTADAHDASAVSIVDAGAYFTGTEVEAALQELGAAGGGAASPIVYVPPGGAATAIQDAIDALPAQGGIIQLGVGSYSPTIIDLSDRENVSIRGVGGVTGGADSNTVIHFSATGSTPKILIDDSTGCGFLDLEIKYTNTGFTGALISSSGSTGQCKGFYTNRVLLWGDHSVGQTAPLMDLNRSIESVFAQSFYNGGGIAAIGRKSVAIASVSVANPTTITTATPHGYTTGQTVTIGGTSTTPATAINPPTIEGFVITVTGASTFTIPVNVSAVAVGTGYATSSIDFCNAVTFRDCEFFNQRIVPIRNAGETFSLINCVSQALANGDLGFYDHLPGCRAKGVTVIGGGCYDQTTTNACSIFKYAGDGLTIMGYKGSGRQVSHVTLVDVDEDGCHGMVGLGNALDNMWIGLNLGSRVNTSGQWGPNSYANILAGYLPVNSATPRQSIEFRNSAGTPPNPGSVFIWDDVSSAEVIQFDADALARIYRLGAGVLYTPSEWRTGSDIYSGYATAAGTRMYGSGGTLAGLAAVGSNSNIDMTLNPKGTGRNVLNSGLSLPTTISPTQLVANTDNWAPTSLETASSIRINVDAARTITGIVAQPSGCTIRLFNTTAFDITLAHDATSTAANRFLCPGATNFTLRQKGSVLIFYSTTDSRWHVVAP